MSSPAAPTAPATGGGGGGSDAETMMAAIMGGAKRQALATPTAAGGGATTTTSSSPRVGAVVPPSYVLNRQVPSYERKAAAESAAAGRAFAAEVAARRQKQPQPQPQQQQPPAQGAQPGGIGVSPHLQPQQQQRPGVPPGLPVPGPGGSLTKAQTYVLASMLANNPEYRMARRPAHARAPGQGGRPPPQARPSPPLVPRRRPQRVITPQMLAPRPVEQRGNIVLRSKKEKGKRGGSDSSVTDSVGTDVTEQVENTQKANARRKRDHKYQPTLEKVDTFEALESKENPNPNIAKNIAKIMTRNRPTPPSKLTTDLDDEVEGRPQVESPSAAAARRVMSILGDEVDDEQKNSQQQQQQQQQSQQGRPAKSDPPARRESPVRRVAPKLGALLRGKRRSRQVGSVHSDGSGKKSNGSNGSEDEEKPTETGTGEQSASKADVSKDSPKVNKTADGGGAPRGRPAYGKKASLITVAEYALSNSAVSNVGNDNGNANGNGGNGNTGNGSEIEHNNDNGDNKVNDYAAFFVADGEPSLPPTKPSSPRAEQEAFALGGDESVKTGVATPLARDSSLLTEATIALGREDSLQTEATIPLGREDSIETKATINGRPDVLRHIKTESGTELLTINMDLLSPAVPSSPMSPRNKGEMEVQQLPQPSSLDDMLEASNERVDRLKKELIGLVRPSAQGYGGDSRSSAASSAPTDGVADDASTGDKAIEGMAISAKANVARKKGDAGSGVSSMTSGSRDSSSKGGGSGDSSGEDDSGGSPSPPGSEIDDNDGDAKRNSFTGKVKAGKRTKGRKKSSPPPPKSFLGRKSKVIEEEQEYAPYEGDEKPEDRDDADHYEENAGARQGVDLREHVKNRGKRASGRDDEDSSSGSGRSPGMQSTLSAAIFSAVESEVTTDQAAFAYKPGIVKRTKTLVKNPGMAIRGRTVVRTAKDEEREMMRRMKQARSLARADGRRKEEFDEEGHGIIHSIKDKANRVGGGKRTTKERGDHGVGKDGGEDSPGSDATPIRYDEAQQLRKMAMLEEEGTRGSIPSTIKAPKKGGKGDVAPKTKGDIATKTKDVTERGVTDVEGDDDSMYCDNSLVMEDNEHQKQAKSPGVGVGMDGGTVEGGTQTSDWLDEPSALGTNNSILAGNIISVPSRERVVPNLIQQPTIVGSVAPNMTNNDFDHDNEPGSLSHCMGSLGLFGAQFCMGTSRAMSSCAQSCSSQDSVSSRAKMGQRFSSMDNDLSLASPSNAAMLHQYQQQQLMQQTLQQPPMQQPSTPQPTGSFFRDCGGGGAMASSQGDPKDGGAAEKEAEGIFTRALTAALRTTMSSDEKKISSPKGQQQGSDVHAEDNGAEGAAAMASPQQAEPGSVREDGLSYADFQSIDGRLVPTRQVQRHQRTAKHVPRNIAVKPKREHHNADHRQPLHTVEENPAEQRIQRTESRDKGKKQGGIGKFFKKLGKTRLAILYEV
ncbi:hypothetical protein ACHAWF_017621 [Thalassiosira exigua]